MRLFGIDAPETRQTCTLHSGEEYACGTDATDALEVLIGLATVNCRGDAYDYFNRLIGWCDADGVDLNREMVRRGWAVAFRRYSELYLAEELDAAKAGVGVWRGPFQRPTEFRSAIWAVGEQQSPEGCPIKGNISSRGKIYHTPWSRSYARTRISPTRGERWFCSEAEALAAGWRAPLR
ncbi:MAG: thermonuclease family protein [Paracoccaceae bacterium]